MLWGQDQHIQVAGYLRKEKRLGLPHALEIIEKICNDCGDTDFQERKRAVQETYNKDEKDVKGFTGLKEREIIVSIDDFLYIKKIKQNGDKEMAVNIDKVAEHIENKFNIRTIYGIKEETIELYDEGIWTIKGKGIIKAEIERLLTNYSKNTIVSVLHEIL